MSSQALSNPSSPRSISNSLLAKVLYIRSYSSKRNPQQYIITSNLLLQRQIVLNFLLQSNSHQYIYLPNPTALNPNPNIGDDLQFLTSKSFIYSITFKSKNKKKQKKNWNTINFLTSNLLLQHELILNFLVRLKPTTTTCVSIYMHHKLMRNPLHCTPASCLPIRPRLQQPATVTPTAAPAGTPLRTRKSSHGQTRSSSTHPS